METQGCQGDVYLPYNKQHFKNKLKYMLAIIFSTKCLRIIAMLSLVTEL